MKYILEIDLESPDEVLMSEYYIELVVAIEDCLDELSVNYTKVELTEVENG